jgi:hypothetical protein
MRSLLGGNIRIFEGAPEWQRLFAASLGELEIVGETAFGLQFARDPGGMIWVFDPEGLSLQSTDCSLEEFIAAVEADADDLVDQGFYMSCVDRLGPIGPDKHYALIRELVLGGTRSADNVEILPATEHMAALRRLSEQVATAVPGTVVRGVR